MAVPHRAAFPTADVSALTPKLISVIKSSKEVTLPFRELQTTDLTFSHFFISVIRRAVSEM